MTSRKKTPDWQQLNQKILAGLDLPAEFAALGIDLQSDSPGAKGWIPCRAFGRQDNTPSAAVHCDTGRYRDLGGTGLSLSFYDLAVHVKRFTRWQDAREHYAAKANVIIDKPPADPAKNLAFLAWSPAMAALWCRHKPGVNPEAIQAAGGRLARYREKYTVIALPTFGPGLTAADPVGWILWNTTGKELPIFQPGGKGNKPKVSWKKMKTTGGSEGGLIGQHAIDRLAATDADPSKQVLWKVEGPPDLLALWAVIPPEKRDRHLVVTNSGGATENPSDWMIPLFAGRIVIVVGDADASGVGGVAKWSAWAATMASKVRVIRPEQLEQEITESHGKDLRDYLTAPHSYSDLLALADAAEIMPAPGPPATSTTGDPAAPATTDDTANLENDDDPHRLARVNLARYNTHHDGRTIAYWREEWYVWKKSAYRKISEKELRAKVCRAVKDEFDRIVREKQAMADSVSRDGDEPLVAQRVTRPLIGNVLEATASLTCISGSIETNTWLPTREPKKYISLGNGLLDIDALLADRPESECLLANTPNWFSFVSLPYTFHPTATCPRWDAYLRHNLADDVNLIAVAQEWAGYLLLHTTDKQKFMILEGEGRNGKSVFIAGLTGILGVENVSNVPLELFHDKFQLYSTVGKLLNAAGDCGEIDRAAEGVLKSFTSGDRMHFDRKQISGVDCAPTARLMMACNNLPRFVDRTEGVWRRMMIIPWRVKIEDNRRVEGMDKAEWWDAAGELPGMFLWAIRGLDRLRKQGRFTKSDTMNAALEEYKEEMNPSKMFLQQFLEESQSGRISSSVLYHFYKKWSEDNGYRPLSERPFGKEIRRVFPNCIRNRPGPRTNRCWAYEGIQFSQDEVCGEKTSSAMLF